MMGKDDFREKHFRETYMNNEGQNGPEASGNNTSKIVLGALALGAAGLVAYNVFTNDTESTSTTPIKAEGFPKGYHIENVNIPTRGEIIRVEKLPGENYQKTVDPKTGIITFKGNFEYEIAPLRSAMPKDDEHSDIYGRTPDNNPYWTDVRNGEVKLHKDDDSLEKKVK